MYLLREIPKSTPVILIHSALGTHKEMLPIAEAIGARTVYTLDLPMHGANPHADRPMNIRTMSEWLLGQIDAEGLTEVDLIGYSLGGYVAIKSATLEAESARPRIRSIVSHAMKFYWTPEAISTAVSGMDFDTLAKRAPKFVDALNANHAAGAREVLAAMRELIGDFERSRLVAADISQLRIPLVLTTGSADELVTPEEVTQLARESGIGAVLLPGVSHAIKTLGVPEFVAVLDQFRTTASI